MANIKSQIKRIKTNEKARQRNVAVKSALKTVVRRVRTAVESGDAAAASADYALERAVRRIVTIRSETGRGRAGAGR